MHYYCIIPQDVTKQNMWVDLYVADLIFELHGEYILLSPDDGTYL